MNRFEAERKAREPDNAPGSSSGLIPSGGSHGVGPRAALRKAVDPSMQEAETQMSNDPYLPDEAHPDMPYRHFSEAALTVMASVFRDWFMMRESKVKMQHFAAEFLVVPFVGFVG